ncbi:addiction module toxin RelE [Candidatus Woesearchaeota archaeon]|nr:addiction module toxin RelE [Candidatus Woesearchaeota archaeon]
MNYEIHPDLDKILSKLSKKDKVQFETILKKIDDIINTENIDHYKNLKSPLQEYKRVHIHSSFVLLFKREEDKIIFRYYDHHDNIYKWKPNQ